MSAVSNENKEVVKNGCSSSKSSDSIYSASSINSRIRMLQRKTQYRQAEFIPARVSSNRDVRQRVSSARLHRFKSIQNQLNEALQQNADLINENRLLKTLHKRQDTALAKYEGTSAELPQLLNSHTEELRVWQTKCKTFNNQNRELNKRLLLKDKTINDLTDRVKHLTRLNADKNLEEREALTAKLQSLEKQLIEKDEDLKVLTRRNHLEAKNFKAQLVNEKKKYKELSQKFEQLNSGKRYGSSTESDRFSAKDFKEIKLTTSNLNLPKYINMNKSLQNGSGDYLSSSKENPQNFFNGMDKTKFIYMDRKESQANSDNDSDDKDLIIRTMMDSKSDNINLMDTQQITQSFSDISIHGSSTLSNLQEIQDQIRNDIETNEQLLDQHCDEISRDINLLSSAENISTIDDHIQPTTIVKKITSAQVTKPLPIFNYSPLEKKPTRRMPIDPQKKIQLLSALKSIHGNS